MKITKNKNQYQIFLDENGIDKSYSLEYSEDFVPHISHVQTELRPILVKNPQATQEIIEAIQNFNKGLVFRQIRLTEWESQQLQVA